MQKSEEGLIYAENPSSDPKGMGFAALLTSEYFGLRSQLDPETLELLEEKRELALKKKRTPKDENRLVELNNVLSGLDFNDTVADPLYYEFTKAMTKEADEELKMPVLTPAAMNRRRQLAKKIVTRLKEE